MPPPARGQPLASAFPHNLRALRKRLKLSQEAFANLIDVAPSYVSMLERGQRLPALDTIDKIAERAGVAPITLVQRTTPIIPPVTEEP